jgi:hypothetical protein
MSLLLLLTPSVNAQDVVPQPDFLDNLSIPRGVHRRPKISQASIVQLEKKLAHTLLSIKNTDPARAFIVKSVNQFSNGVPLENDFDYFDGRLKTAGLAGRFYFEKILDGNKSSLLFYFKFGNRYFISAGRVEMRTRDCFTLFPDQLAERVYVLEDGLDHIRLLAVDHGVVRGTENSNETYNYAVQIVLNFNLKEGVAKAWGRSVINGEEDWSSPRARYSEWTPIGTFRVSQ